MKKGSFIMLVVVLILTLIAGCSTKEDKSVSSSVTPSVIPSATAIPQVSKKFTMLTESHPSWPYMKDALVWKLIEEKTGVTLDMQVPSGTLPDTINLNAASGTMPDITFMLDLKQANKLGQQGALVNILDYKDQMPNLKKWTELYPDAVKTNLAADGKLYMTPNQGIGETNRTSWLYREDIFNKNGLKAPTTFDELYTVLKKLKELYPTSYPLSLREDTKDPLRNIIRDFSPAFSTNETYYLDSATNEVKYGPTDDNYKKLITYLNKFYKEGLMPPDWLTTDTKKWQEQISTNMSFITMDYISRIDFFNVSLKKTNPEFNLAFMAPPVGLSGGKHLNPYTQFVQSGMTVSSKSKNIKDIMQYMDFFYSEEGKTLMSWGKEGETYTIEGGKKKFKPEYVEVGDLRKKTNLSTNGAYNWFDYDAHLSLASKDLQNAYVEARKYDDVLRLIPDFDTEQQVIISTKGDAIDKYRNEAISKFIFGSKSLDEWNQYVEGAKKLGLQEVMGVYKAAIDRNSKTSLK